MWDYLINIVETKDLSDLHIHADEPVAYREHGAITKDEKIFSQDDIKNFLKDELPEADFMTFIDLKDFDFAISKGDLRFRANAFQSKDKFGLVLRKIESNIPSFEKLNLPPYISKVPDLETGLVLVTGPTGSGKSTTLAAILDIINANHQGHIITIEDPTEFIHQPKKCVISQREVGRDTKSFLNALRASLREDPDVILVGELRDLETIQLALTAAETGHLVFGTLHTNSAPSTMTRIIDVFPPSQQDQIRSQLAGTLRCVLTQKLLKRVDQPGRCAAFELLINTTATANLIRENKIFQIANVMQTAKGDGMILMENSLKNLVAEGKIDPSEAM
jgi:twitching motility protein PilT